jgi:hypothetical protein
MNFISDLMQKQIDDKVEESLRAPLPHLIPMHGFDLKKGYNISLATYLDSYEWPGHWETRLRWEIERRSIRYQIRTRVGIARFRLARLIAGPEWPDEEF